MFLRFKRICAVAVSVALLQGTAFAFTKNLDANGILTIEGTVAGSASDNVYIQVVNPNKDVNNLTISNFKEILNQAVMVPVADNKYEYSYKLSGAEGWYKIWVNDGTGMSSQDIYFIDSEDLQDIIDELKDRTLTPSEDSLKTKMLTTYIDPLGLDLTIYNTIKDNTAATTKLFSHIFNNMGKVADADDLREMFYAEVLVQKINLSSGTDIKALLTSSENIEWLKFDITASITYGALTETGTDAFYSNMSSADFIGRDDLEAKAKEILLLTAIEKVATWGDINSIIEDNKGIIAFNYSRYNTSLKRSDIDRAIAGNKYTLTELGEKIDALSYVSTDSTPVYTGGGGGGGFAVTPVEEPKNEPDAVIEGFKDIQSHWAKEYIDKLYELGIVNGVSETEFAPDNNVKREEFVKMLVGLFKLEIAEYDQYAFLDIPKGHWSYPYVTTARKYGILQGVDGNNFGAEREITREDMMVLLDRTISTLEIETFVKSADVSFKDYDEISAYAKEAVINLAKSGVISGYEDGSFRGANPATRGETAKILSVFTDYIK